MKNFLKSNTFYGIVSVVAAIIIWTYVTYSVNPDYEVWVEDVPVACTNVSALFKDGSLAIKGEYEQLLSGGVTVDVQLKGKRNVVSTIDKEDIACELDMLTVTGDGTYTLRPSVSTEHSDVLVSQIDPGNFRLNVEAILQNDIELDIITTGTLPSGYEIENVQYKNTSVKITGADSIINAVDKAEVHLDYSALSVYDREKILGIIFKDKNGNPVDSSAFGKSIEHLKVTFDIITHKDVTVVLVPRYEDEQKQNLSGKNVLLKLVDGSDKRTDGGKEIKVRLRGTEAALEKYTSSAVTVYTEPIDVRNIYSETIIKDVKAAPLSNSVEYTEIPQADVKATPQTAKE